MIRNNRSTGVNGIGEKIFFGGGGIACWKSSPSIIDCDIQFNRSSSAGGGVLCWDASPTIRGGTIESNRGIGVSIDGPGGGSPRIIDCGIRDNFSGIFCQGPNNILIEGCTIADHPNLGIGAHEAGAMTVRSSAITESRGVKAVSLFETQALLENCVVSDNSGLGISVYLADDLPTIIRSSEIARNNAGGVEIAGQGSNSGIVGCTIANNSREFSGGGLTLHYTDVRVENCLISENSAIETWTGTGGYGGGIDNSSSGGPGQPSPTLINCIIVGNTAAKLGGAVCASYHTRPQLINCTLSDNTADVDAGALYAWNDAAPSVKNCILWNNGLSEIGQEGVSGPDVDYSDVQGGWPGTGNLNVNPQFVSSIRGDYHLHSTSPCIDEGTGAGAPDEDFDGDPRPFGSNPDMGADEYLPCELDVRVFDAPYTVAHTQLLEFGGTTYNPCDATLDYDRVELQITGPLDYSRTIYRGAPLLLAPGEDRPTSLALPVSPVAPLGRYEISVVDYRGRTEISRDSFELDLIEKCDVEPEILAYTSTVNRGGQFDMTGTTYNGCDESLSYDRAVLELDGAIHYEYVIYDGAPLTLKPGEDLPATVELRVSPATPVGDYDLSLVDYRNGFEIGRTTRPLTVR